MGLLDRLFNKGREGSEEPPGGADCPEREGVPLGLNGEPLLKITEPAREKINAIVASQNPPVSTIRVSAQAHGKYSMALEHSGKPGLDDTVLPYHGFRILIDPLSLPHLEGAEIDWRETFGGGGFHFTPPPPKRSSRPPRVAPPEGPQGEVWRQIQAVLDEEVNPQVAAHGGYIDLIDVRGDKVFVEMGGGCQGCAMSKATLKQGVEKAIRARVPAVGEILDVTDHAGGTNPYYRP